MHARREFTPNSSSLLHASALEEEPSLLRRRSGPSHFRGRHHGDAAVKTMQRTSSRQPRGRQNFPEVAFHGSISRKNDETRHYYLEPGTRSSARTCGSTLPASGSRRSDRAGARRQRRSASQPAGREAGAKQDVTSRLGVAMRAAAATAAAAAAADEATLPEEMNQPAAECEPRNADPYSTLTLYH